MADKYRVGIIGRTGRGDYGHALDEAFLSIPECEIVAVADDDKVGLAKAAERLKVGTTFVDYREMLDKTKPDIVAICQRWIDQHAEMILAAAERGIHMIIEKPFVRTPAEADQVIAACEKTHARIVVGHPTHFSPKLAMVKKLIADGKIGKVLEYRARGKEDRRGGGEDLWVLGTHLLDMIRVLGGQPTWCFGRVLQSGQPVTKADVRDGAEGIGPLAGDTVNAIYGLADGAIATFASQQNMAGKPSRFGLQIYGSRGILEILEGPLPDVKFLGDGSWSPGRSGVAWQNVSSAGIDVPEPLSGSEYTNRYSQAIRELLRAMEAQSEPTGGMYEGRDVTEMIAAVFESHRLGRPVSLPLETRENPLTLL